MDSLFGVPLTSILIALLVMTGAIFGVLAYIGWRNPLLVRMGVRNIARRKAQTALIVIGLMLSTLIISAAFATGDTVGYSVTSTVYNDFAGADVVAALDQDLPSAQGRDSLLQSDVEAVRQGFAGDERVDGVTGLLQTPVPALNPGERLSEPSALLVGVDPGTADDFNALVTLEGEQLLASDLAPGEVYVSRELAKDVRLDVGSTVTIFVENEPHDFTVAGIVRDNALTASTAITGGGQTAGGIVAPIERVREILGEPERVDLLVISATGGVRGTADLIDGIDERLDEIAAAQDIPVSSFITKAEAVEFAELIGSVFVTFFLVFGLFSMAAGVMLIFLTFVMLAAERRSEMGMARAVGMKRLHLTQAFIAEGMTYNLGSALVGAVLGLGVAYGLIFAMGQVFEEFGLNIEFHVNATGFLISYFLGVVITFVTVAFSSWRSANLNIVRAIRDIPEPEPMKGRDTSIGALAKATIGAVWYLLWVAVIALAALLLVFSFIFGLGFFAIPVLVAALAIAFYVWGLRALGRPKGTLGWVGLIGWWVIFNVVALLGFFLLRTKGWSDRHRSSGGWAVLMLVIGGLSVWWGGWVAQQAFAYTAGTTLVLFAIALLLVFYGARPRPTFAVISALTIWYWLMPLPFNLLFEEGKGWTDPVNGFFSLFGLEHEPIVGNIEMFFVSGICITAASTVFVIFNADRLLGSLGLLQRVFGGLTPAIRTAISYPLAAKFRTGMTLAMFTLVMFSLVVMATLNYNFTQIFLGEAAQGGFDVQATANPNNPIEDLRAALSEAGYEVEEHIAAVGTLTATADEAQLKPAEEPEDEFHTYALAGLDAEFLQTAAFPMSTIAEGYASEEAVLEALRTDPSVIVANEMVLSFTQTANFMDPDDVFSIEGSISDLQDASWEPIPVVVRDTETGEERTMHIIGFVDSPIISGVVPQWMSLFVNPEVVADFAEDPAQSFFVTTVAGTDEAANDVAAAIESTLLERGVQADSLQQRVEDSAAQSNAFSALFQAFMSLGLIVGIAALGVIAFRTVAERRQQIGMMRAIGYSRRLVAISFFMESSFIALAGVGMGFVLGAALSYNLMTSPDFTNGAEIDFGIPWLRLLIIIGGAYLATALMTFIPARSASRVPVAEALRYE